MNVPQILRHSSLAVLQRAARALGFGNARIESNAVLLDGQPAADDQVDRLVAACTGHDAAARQAQADIARSIHAPVEVFPPSVRVKHAEPPVGMR